MSNHLTPSDRPTGTVTFLFTDIEGSTRLWEEFPDLMPHAFARHEAIIRDAVAAHGGYAYKMIGDAFQVAFQGAPTAVACAAAIQRALTAEPWGEIGAIRVRMGLHTGSVEERGDDYVGPQLNRVARLMGAGYGGQVLLTDVTTARVQEAVSGGLALADLGYHRLRNLLQPERVSQLVITGLLSEFPPLRSINVKTVPELSSPLIGRKQAVESLCRMLRGPARLVTLTGPGGTGKTTLSLAVARELRFAFRDGLFFVELAPLSEPDLVAVAIAHALGAPDSPGTAIQESLVAFLKNRSLLLVLDNFEHLMPAAPLVGALITAAPELRLLVSSREALRVRCEKLFEVPPLSLPDRKQYHAVERLLESPAVALFVQRAQALNPDFTLTPDNAAAVADLCVHLDGLPLAIELAAARTRLHSPQVMVRELARRFKWQSHLRDTPERHRTLHDMMSWSYDLLSDTERSILRHLGIFVGGFTLEAAVAVCEAAGDDSIEEGVVSLLDKSLLRRQERGEEPRFYFLETIRQFVAEHLDADPLKPELQRAHVRYFMTLAERTDVTERNDGGEAQLAHFVSDKENLRAALESGLRQRYAETATRLAAAAHYLWVDTGELETKKRWLEQAIALAADATPAIQGKLYSGMGTLLWRHGQYAEALIFHELSLRLFEQVDDRKQVMNTLSNVAVQHFELGNYTESRAVFERGLRVANEESNVLARANMLLNAGELARVMNDLPTARRYYEESEVLNRRAGIRIAVASIRHNISHVLIHEGKPEQALQSFRESLAICLDIGYENPLSFENMLVIVAGIAGSFGRLGNPALAACLFGAFAAIQQRINLPLNAADAADYERNVAIARAQLAETVWAHHWDRGAQMELEEAVTLALEP